MTAPSLVLQILPDQLALCRLAPDAALPPAALRRDGFFAVTRTADELSLVLPAALVPPNAMVEGGWRAIKVQGPLAFTMTGVLASMAVPLAEAGISIVAISTFETDYLLVREEVLARAKEVLSGSGTFTFSVHNDGSPE